MRFQLIKILSGVTGIFTFAATFQGILLPAIKLNGEVGEWLKPHVC